MSIKPGNPQTTQGVWGLRDFLLGNLSADGISAINCVLQHMLVLIP